MAPSDQHGDPYRPARDDRDAVVTRLVERLPDRVTATLNGDREALIGLLHIAADWAWQSRAEVLGTVVEVAGAAHQFADAVADCYSAGEPPTDRLCDDGFTLADRVDALAVEVLLRRQQTGNLDDAALPDAGRPLAFEARHLCRAHVAALRDAAAAELAVSDADVQAAQHLYRVIVAWGRAQAVRAAATALQDPRADRTAPAADTEA